jgi:hypothetical protein
MGTGKLVDCCSDGDPYECHCSCHSDRKLGLLSEHCTPCCEVSPCGLKIMIGAMQLYISQCERCRTVGEQAAP